MFHVSIEQEEAAEEKREAPATGSDEHPSVLQFVTGNPHVEIISGLLHLFRGVHDQQDDVADPDFIASTRTGMKMRLPTPRSTVVCIVAVPSHMSVNDLVEFIKKWDLIRRYCVKVTFSPKT